MEQISAGIDRLNSLIKEQSASINDSSTEIGKLIRHIEESTETLTKNNENIMHLSDTSEQGKIALHQITVSIEDVTKHAQEVVEKFRLIEKEVGVVSKQESTILKTMEEQTANSRKVMDSIGIINDITKKVQQSSFEMLEGSRQITKEAQNMNVITQEISGGMTEMATGADQITEAVATVNELTEDTKNSIASLTTEVHKFKV